MVRLRVSSATEGAGIAIGFQFLYGSIKSLLITNKKAYQVKFQFLYGSIKREKDELHGWLLDNFNSYMVRLRAVNIQKNITDNQPITYIIIKIKHKKVVY